MADKAEKIFRPAVDLVIAVHSASRPIERAVESAMAAGLPINEDGGLRISVVCHNIEQSKISSRLSDESRESVRWLSCDDGIPSPAGPFNAGIARATADFVSVMGSDDFLEPGAMAAWLEVARRHSSAAVIAPQRHAQGGPVRTPPVRVGRRRNLDPVRDRLSYRTAPLGLLATAEIRRLGLSFTPGLKTGEDQEFSAKLWFGGGRIDFARGAGRYVVGSDAGDRVTFTRREVSDELNFTLLLVRQDWFAGLPIQSRRAIVTKILRVHVFGLLTVRAEHGGWTAEDLAELRSLVGELLAVAPGATDPFSYADHRVLQEIISSADDAAELVSAARNRRKFGQPNTLFAKGFFNNFKVEAPLRFITASLLFR